MAFSVNFKDFEKKCVKNWEHGSPTHNHVKVFTKIKLALSVVRIENLPWLVQQVKKLTKELASLVLS
jgi:hypothetical protein